MRKGESDELLNPWTRSSWSRDLAAVAVPRGRSGESVGGMRRDARTTGDARGEGRARLETTQVFLRPLASGEEFDRAQSTIRPSRTYGALRLGIQKKKLSVHIITIFYLERQNTILFDKLVSSRTCQVKVFV